MKHKKLFAFTLASTLLLGGCSSIPQEKGKDVVASIQQQNILADDLYTQLSQSTAGKNALFSLVMDQLIAAHFPATKDMEMNADELVENIKTQFKNQYGDKADEELEKALSNDNFKNIDEYKKSLIYSLQMTEFLKDYVKKNYDDVFEDYYKNANPRYISLIKVQMINPEKPSRDESAKLKEIQSLIKTDKSFESIASEYSDDTTKTAHGKLGIVDNTSHIDQIYGEEVKEAALELKENKTSKPIQVQDGVIILHCSSMDKAKMKKELKTIDIESPLLTYDPYLVYFAFQQYDLEYEDKDIQKTIEKIIKESLEARKELRGGKA